MPIEARKNIPNLVTLLSLACACWAIILIMEGQLFLAGTLLLATTLMDGLDGALARHLNVSSELGLQLDSLADVVCFGVGPAILMIQYLRGTPVPWPLAIFSGLIFLLSGAFRLARFNVMAPIKTNPDSTGLPITGAGGLLVLLIYLNYQHGPLTILPEWLPFIAIALSLLMVSRIPFLSKSSNRKLTMAGMLFFVFLALCYNFPIAALIVMSAHLSHGLVRASYGQWRRWRRRHKTMPALPEQQT
jgi:CDP-diacylglycerol--serine O-phosphatidyltransferase